MKRAVVCPVCNGKGELLVMSGGMSMGYRKPCHGCKGKGWVEVGGL